MSDIVERLRRHGEYEAAKEIEYLRAENDRLTAVIHTVAKYAPGKDAEAVQDLTLANAELRASNAELLVALKTCLPHIEPIAADKYEIARAAIKKAEGHE